MKNTLSTTHVTFRELALQERWLFYISALGTYGLYRCIPPPMEELEIALELIWNRNRLSPADLNPPERTLQLLREEFAVLGTDRHRRWRA
jgi:hypothetical protein